MPADVRTSRTISAWLARFPLEGGRGWGRFVTPFLLIAAVVSGFATYAALTSTPPFGHDPHTVLWILNIDLIILLLLVTLIAQGLVKLVGSRRRKLAGAGLHVRLVMIFGILAAAPAIIMTVFSAFFFHYGVQSWFSDRVETAVLNAQAVAESYLEEHKQVIRADTLAMANDLDRQAYMFIDNPRALESAVQAQSLLRNFSEALIFEEDGHVIAKSGLTFTLGFTDLPQPSLSQAQDGEVAVMTGENEDRVRALVRLSNFGGAYLFVGRMVDPDVISKLDSTRDAAEEYTQLQGSYAGLQVTVTMIFVVVALLMVLAAVWLGIILARQLVSPIGALISAADRVRGGDLSARVSEQERIEEFDYLGRSFNRMTSQLQEQRNELVAANRQLDQRRRFTEAVLAGVSAGIVGVDDEGVITLANQSAASLFERDISALTGQKIEDILPDIGEALQQAYDKPGRIVQTQIPYRAKGGLRRILLARISLESMNESHRGAVLTFDDITELQSAQRKAAWSDVARRIAHEIKNPLTPIQLSAERLKRKYLKEIQSDPDTFSQCTETIIRHVGDIGRMVNEFSSFARMPVPVMREIDLATHIRETLVLQKEAHPEIAFALTVEEGLSNVVCDAQQIRQAFTNLIQNAVDAIQEGPRKGEIHIDLLTLDGGESCALVVSDNGPGLPDHEDPAYLTEPYVTHKAKGTGLGLAIVKKIMEDHGGNIVLGTAEWMKGQERWNELGGATVILVLPVRPKDWQGKKKAA